MAVRSALLRGTAPLRLLLATVFLSRYGRNIVEAEPVHTQIRRTYTDTQKTMGHFSGSIHPGRLGSTNKAQGDSTK
jgi:hypothetical protein